MLVENHGLMVKAIKNEGADLGIAFDGDFDRCFFFIAQVGLFQANMWLIYCL